MVAAVTAYDGGDMFALLDLIFADNSAQFSQSPEDILSVLTERCAHRFSTCKSINYVPAKHGELVHMRCMIQCREDREFYVVSYGSRSTNGGCAPNATDAKIGCGLLKDTINISLSSDIQENSTFHERYSYKVIPVPYATEWYTGRIRSAICGGHAESNGSIDTIEVNGGAAEDETSLGRIIFAKFITSSAEDLALNRVYDLYGIIDLSNVSCEVEPTFGQEHCSTCSLQVIKFHEPDFKDILPHCFQKPKLSSISMYISCLRCILIDILCDDLVADYLLCHLISTTFIQHEMYPVCSMPMNLINVSKSKDIVSLLNLICAKVNVIEVSQQIFSESILQPVKDHEHNILNQNRLQMSDGTHVIFDETSLNGNLSSNNENVKRNLNSVRLLAKSQTVQYDFSPSMPELNCDINVLVLSKKRSTIMQFPFLIPLPFEFSGQSEKIKSLHGFSELMDICRNAILCCRDKVKDVTLRKENEEFVNTFLRIRRDAPEQGAVERFQSLLILSRLIGALEYKDEVDSSCWKKAIALEERRLARLTSLKL